ncbi:hypothetical protein KJ934_01305 [Patescibacteria group bacterium]|nr:hypothetical protein [Patescibacteria group bacterium]MBU4353085.1 hypothetical protein [Patescibacteria group bacterium]MBU4477184.1 hypothetical protein [Patescibacteria group bacterium]MCG2699105.1 hypothetical protein [Candidatus Parcubacteria bacterium]
MRYFDNDLFLFEDEEREDGGFVKIAGADDELDTDDKLYMLDDDEAEPLDIYEETDEGEDFD